MSGSSSPSSVDGEHGSGTEKPTYDSMSGQKLQRGDRRGIPPGEQQSVTFGNVTEKKIPGKNKKGKKGKKVKKVSKLDELADDEVAVLTSMAEEAGGGPDLLSSPTGAVVEGLVDTKAGQKLREGDQRGKVTEGDEVSAFSKGGGKKKRRKSKRSKYSKKRKHTKKHRKSKRKSKRRSKRR